MGLLVGDVPGVVHQLVPFHKHVAVGRTFEAATAVSPASRAAQFVNEPGKLILYTNDLILFHYIVEGDLHLEV